MTAMDFFYVVASKTECEKYISIRSRYKNEKQSKVIINKSDLNLIPGDTDEAKLALIKGEIISTEDINTLLQKNNEWKV